VDEGNRMYNRNGKRRSAEVMDGRMTLREYVTKERENAPLSTRLVGLDETSTVEAAGNYLRETFGLDE